MDWFIFWIGGAIGVGLIASIFGGFMLMFLVMALTAHG